MGKNIFELSFFKRMHIFQNLLYMRLKLNFMKKYTVLKFDDCVVYFSS